MTAPIIIVLAGALAEATRPALPKRKGRTHKPRPLALTYDRFIQALRISEVQQGAFQTTVPLSVPAVWPEEVIVDGALLARLAATFAPEANITLSHNDTSLILACDKMSARVNRLTEQRGAPRKNMGNQRFGGSKQHQSVHPWKR